MIDPNSDLTLASEFPAPTREAWRKLVDGVLKGRPFEQLVSRTYDGVLIEPLYPRAPDARPLAGRAARPWRIMQRVDHPDPAAANAEALDDLENGATGLTLICAGSINANGYGIDGSAATLARVLDGVHLDAGITIDFNVGPETRGVVRHFAQLVKDRKIAPGLVDLRASINPIGGMAAAGGSEKPWSDLAPAFAALIGELAGLEFRGPFAVADGRIIHNAGGSEVQELAFAIASATAYLRALEASGTALDVARSRIYFRLAADADQFLSIAKFRALRKLWTRVEQACGLAPKPAYVSAETAWRMMTKRDPWVNILRATLAVFSAGLGGADAIAVLPHTAALGLPDRLARRIARNTHLLLLEESNLAKVADPVAGSGAIEDLTDKLCRAAWTLFQEIERAGGVAAALESGLIQDKVVAVRAERERAIAHRRDVLTGTTEFPNLAEAPVSVFDVRPFAPAPSPTTIKFGPMPRLRLAEPFERLRDASDRILADTGSRPKVFLANLGRPSDFTARASFAKNFFEAGGIEAVTNDGFLSSPLPVGERSTPKASGEGVASLLKARNPSPGPAPSAPDRPLPTGEVKTDLAALVAGFRDSGARLACLCSSDKIYAREAEAAAKALVAAGARHIYAAGKPREIESALKKAGVGTFFHAGSDALATLQAAYDILAVQV